jgi:hypothetical protein
MHNREDNLYYKKRHHLLGKKSLIFFSFLFILGVIFFTTIYDGGLTGGVVKNLNSNNSFSISSETNVPNINFQGDYSEITFEISANQNLILEEKEISLDKISNSLVLKDFYGEINFDQNSIKLLKGKVSEVRVNGMKIKDGKNKKMKISLTGSRYDSINFGEIYLDELNFVSSGKINLEGDIISLNRDEVTIKNLFGEFSVKENKLFFDGLIKSLDIKREDKRISISK